MIGEKETPREGIAKEAMPPHAPNAAGRGVPGTPHVGGESAVMAESSVGRRGGEDVIRNS